MYSVDLTVAQLVAQHTLGRYSVSRQVLSKHYIGAAPTILS